MQFVEHALIIHMDVHVQISNTYQHQCNDEKGIRHMDPCFVVIIVSSNIIRPAGFCNHEYNIYLYDVWQ